MEKKNNRSRLDQSTVCGVDLALKVKLAQTYLDELKGLKNEEEIKEWFSSIPEGLERILLFLLALDRVKDSV